MFVERPWRRNIKFGGNVFVAMKKKHSLLTDGKLSTTIGFIVYENCQFIHESILFICFSVIRNILNIHRI